MNVVDSSAWLEYFADGPNAGEFEAAIEDVESLVVPTICLFEVGKRVMQQRGESAALAVVAAMRQGHVVDLDADLAFEASRLSLRDKLPLADSIVYATVRRAGALLWTQDADFKGKSGVEFRRKRAKE